MIPFIQIIASALSLNTKQRRFDITSLSIKRKCHMPNNCVIWVIKFRADQLLKFPIIVDLINKTKIHFENRTHNFFLKLKKNHNRLQSLIHESVTQTYHVTYRPTLFFFRRKQKALFCCLGRIKMKCHLLQMNRWKSSVIMVFAN